ncbi:MAG: sigma-70 family RNA polymerase sigma factor [Bacteroidota bacterium]|nr:sigma-70 family RNA polymerase sigma factor [Bacteroidota bacterium]
MLDPNLWVDRYGDYLYQYAMSRLGNSELAEDLVQEVFLSALKAMDHFEGRSSEKTWLTSILKNKIIDHYRKVTLKPSDPNVTGRRETSLENFFFNGEWLEPQRPREATAIFEKDLRNEEFLRTLGHCLDGVSERNAEAFRLKYLEEMDSEEICKLLNISPSNYWVMVHRAKLELRKCLETNWLNDE